MATLQCDIVTPEGTLFSAEAEMVVVPGAEGELGVMPRHAPIVAQLEVGETRVRVGPNEWRRFATSDGYFMVRAPRPWTRAVAPSSWSRARCRPRSIDAATAQAAVEDAKARLAAAEGGDEKVDRFRAERDLAHAENQLRILQRRVAGPRAPASRPATRRMLRRTSIREAALMHPVQVDVDYVERRSRLTTFFRAHPRRSRTSSS